MMRFCISVKTSLVVTIVLMGLLGLSLALITSNLYRDVVLQNKRDSLSELVGIKTQDLLEKLEQHSLRLGNNLKISDSFNQALAEKNTAALSYLLEQQFHQYFVTANVIQLERLLIFSENFEVIVTSSSATSQLGEQLSVCPALIQQAGQRHGAARLRVSSALCGVRGRPYFAVLLPLGGLIPTAYLEVVTDPTLSLVPTEKALGMPIQIRLPDDKYQPLYHSADWPTSSTDIGLRASYQLDTTLGAPALLVEVYNDIEKMGLELKQTRNTMLIISAVLIVVVTMFALFLLRRTLIKPLEVLGKQLKRLREDRKNLGEAIAIRSNIIEVNQLVDDFNMMAAELHGLYGRLEHMAYTDPMTQLPNRGLFNNYTDSLLAEYSGSGRRLALFLIDLDEFKEVNDIYGHAAGDTLLCEMAARMNAALRTADISESGGLSLATISNYDLLVRLGGDEFAVVLPDITSLEQVNEVALKLIATTREPLLFYENSITIRLSIGIAIYPDDGSGRTSLLRHADDAMYYAKKNALDHCFYQQEMSASKHRR